ncbi:MAG: HNH endonuclease, partial [Actinobacteria bacterium]|nr:HNH endonuclease [Actinomycetota bacterium]
EADPMASTTGDPRTRDEIRADVLTDLLLGDGGVCPQPSAQGRATACTEERTWPSIRARVQVILTEAHLAGSSNDGSRIDVEGRAGEPEIPEGELFAVAPAPPELLGYGPIDTASARRVAGEASHWETIHEHPGTGAVLSVDRYRPSEAMRRLLGARDQHCRFPGCRAPVHRCDIDHTVDAALGGATSTDNLAHLCRGHHTLKHHTGWRVKQDSGGVLRWTSPSGRVHLDRPDRLPSRVRFSAETAEPSASHPPPGAPF